MYPENISACVKHVLFMYYVCVKHINYKDHAYGKYLFSHMLTYVKHVCK